MLCGKLVTILYGNICYARGIAPVGNFNLKATLGRIVESDISDKAC